VLVTRPVYELSSRLGVTFEPIGDVQLKGFSDPMSLFVARDAE
jgi:hypothetical protein